MNKTNKGLLDEQEVRRTIGLLFPDNRIFEIRVLGENFNLSGYFNNADTLLKAFDTVDLRKTNVYMTLQTLNEQCYARSQRDRFMRKTKAATSDTDVKGYSWFFIDIYCSWNVQCIWIRWWIIIYPCIIINYEFLSA